MTSIARVRVVSSGYSGGPGLSQFFFLPVTGTEFDQAGIDKACLDVRQLFLDCASVFATGWQAQVDTEVVIFDSASGDLTNVMAAASTAVVAGAGNAQGPAPAGACLRWLTGGIIKGRRLSGRTFLVPLASSAYEANGTLAPSPLITIRDAGTKLATAAGSTLVVWHRPNGATGAAGSALPVNGAALTDKVAVLRSRRD